MLIQPLRIAAAFVTLGLGVQAAEPRSLAERLGYQATDRLLIINGDDAGMCHAANAGTIESLEQGLMTTATIMVPCPWFPALADHARTHPNLDFGVHLAHTAEWKFYRWGPVAPREQVPGLVDPAGCLWPSIQEVHARATPEEALIEGRAQIRKALAAGVEVTHLDSHMGTLQLDARFMETYLKLAVEFDLPLRMASQATLEKFQQPKLRALFAGQGIVFPDDFVYEELKDESKDVKGFWLRVLQNLKPGVTELYIHAAKPTDELRAITGSWKTRGEEFQTFTHDADIRKVITERGIIRLGYRPLRELQRAERKAAGR
jgi:predicted glycoside hydrolase/deacetylase ChbG (UPF0249 family)